MLRLFSIVLILFSSVTQAKTELRFYTWAKDLSPIITIVDTDRKRTYQGIVADIFDTWPANSEYNIRYELHNRNRGEQALYDGEVDISILSREWVEYPDKLIFSEPIYVHKEYLYRLVHTPEESLDVMLDDAVVCARRGYRYPNLEPYFQSGYSFRIDSHIEEVQFNMLLRERCKLAITNEFVANQIIDRLKITGKVTPILPPVNVVNFTFALHPSRMDVMEQLNTHIIELRDTGELEKVVSKHSSINTEEN